MCRPGHTCAAFFMAEKFHEAYERLAPECGYETRKETAIPFSEIPEDSPNKILMIRVCHEMLKWFRMR